SYLKLRSDFLREFKSMSAYVPAIVSRPRKSEWDAHRLTSSKPTNQHVFIIIKAELTNIMGISGLWL
ncbi:hypothetical protein, partial [Lactiplantibacillus pentosus]|uniref:hypothetical protein n=2 Tax=Lactiplantibacillus pentosus TaxID=1589 RepID=UPI002181FB60